MLIFLFFLFCHIHICNRFKKTSDKQKCIHVNIRFIGINVDPVNPRACLFCMCAITPTTTNSTVCVSFQSRILTSPRHPSIFPTPFCNWCWNDVINDVWKYPPCCPASAVWRPIRCSFRTHLWAAFTSGKLAINLLPANTCIRNTTFPPPSRRS